MKILLGLGGFATLASPLAVVISCGTDTGSVVANPQKDVDFVRDAFQQANLVVNSQLAVKSASGEFNAKVLQDLGGYNGVYPGITIPEGVSMTYKLNDVPIGSSDYLEVTISKSRAHSKTFYVLVDVTNVKLIYVNDDTSARNHVSYNSGSKTVTVDENVGEISYDLSLLTHKVGGKDVKWDIEHVVFTKPTNTLKIGSKSFQDANITDLDLSGITNLTSIGSDAFLNSQITSLNIKNLTYLNFIRYSAFKSAALNDLELVGLSHLSEIGNSTFESSKLTSLDLSALHSLYRIGNKAFNKSILTTLVLDNLSKLETIGYPAFASAELDSLDLKDLTELRSIGSWAFDNSPLKTGTLDFSKSTLLESIGKDAFENAQLTHLDLSNLANSETIGLGFL